MGVLGRRTARQSLPEPNALCPFPDIGHVELGPHPKADPDDHSLKFPTPGDEEKVRTRMIGHELPHHFFRRPVAVRILGDEHLPYLEAAGYHFIPSGIRNDAPPLHHLDVMRPVKTVRVEATAMEFLRCLHLAHQTVPVVIHWLRQFAYAPFELFHFVLQSDTLTFFFSDTLLELE